ncbi:MAG: hypothetical protein A2017_18180 [Lentisphaerae bacterium GWF2_44_16]|nr:MAG: hypothetical protein A2017_18180 [Lentisphaerae bacterium GWF2_44_16]
MLALSIQQPWPWLIVKGYKPVENRTWKTPFRGEFLIHASKTFDWEALSFLKENFTELFWEIILEFKIDPKKEWHVCSDKMGGIVGKATLVDCVTQYDSPWFFGPYGLVLKDVQELPFYRYLGSLKFFEVKEYTLQEAQ